MSGISEERARALTKGLLDSADAARWARQAQALADPTRLQILDLLSQEHELSVSTLCLILQRGQSAVSRHLGILREAGLIESYRFDVWVYSKVTRDGQRLLAALLDGDHEPDSSPRK